MNKRIIATIFCAMTLLSAAFAQPPNNNLSSGNYPKLESILSQLISSEDPQEFAMTHNLFMKNGNIRVVLELSDETAVLPDYIIEEIR